MRLFPPRCSGSCFNYTAANAFAQLHVALWRPCMAKFCRVGDEKEGWYCEQGDYTSELEDHLYNRGFTNGHQWTNWMVPSAENFALTRLLALHFLPRRIASSVGRELFLRYRRGTAITKSEILHSEMLCKQRVRWPQLYAVLTIITPGATLLQDCETVS